MPLDKENKDSNTIKMPKSTEKNRALSFTDERLEPELVEIDDAQPTSLYNDVEIDATHADHDADILDFKVEELMAIPQTDVPFTADNADRATAPISQDPLELIMLADVKNPSVRQEPVMSETAELDKEAGFAAVDSANNFVSDEGEEEPEVAESSLPVNPKKGSKLGMGWFQGFNLFILGVVFLGVAILAYFIFGEEALYTGKLPKYIVVENEESGSMGILNPLISEDERQAYIYVPKVEREVDIVEPVLDDVDTTKTLTQISLLSDGSAKLTDEVVEETAGDDNQALANDDAEGPGFELLSSDPENEGLSSDDMEMVELFNQQAGYAFMQGNFVGVDQNDAYYYYQESLKIDPENAAAANGLTSIADIYYKSAFDAYNRGDVEIAQQYLAIGLKVLPSYTPLLELQTEIRQSTSSNGRGSMQNDSMQNRSFQNEYMQNESRQNEFRQSSGFQFD